MDHQECGDTEHAFVEWARGQAVGVSIPSRDDGYDDLSFMASVIGNKRLVAVGESAHYLREWNRWRARLFKFLVIEKGFSTFVLECGLVESRLVHDYVAGAEHDWNNLAQSINNVWGVWAEINDLIRWMREWNLDPARSRELRFYGMDGSGNWSQAQTAYRAVYDYALRVDLALADDLASELEQPLVRLTLATREQFTRAEFTHLIGTAALVVSRIEQARIAYTELTSNDDYEWVLRSAQIMRDVISALGQTEADFEIGLRQLWNVRDVSMAESLCWIREREGHDAAMVIGAHNTHLQRHPVRVQRATSMGSYFASRFGRDEMLLIGTASERSVKGEAPRADSNQAAYAKVGPASYFLDLRAAPTTGPVREWLQVERPDRSNLRYQPVCAGDAWDCLIFSQTLSTGGVEAPAYMHSPPALQEFHSAEQYAGRYLILGFLAAENTLDVYVDGQTLCTNGRDDTSGEVFPPYEAGIHLCEDGRYRWTVWPSIIEFFSGADGRAVSVTTPGGNTYFGVRTGDAVRP
ncbi:MAG: erythromycin esterase [Gammaproteobacteria bacterium]|jgi:erythromycin esterase